MAVKFDYGRGKLFAGCDMYEANPGTTSFVELFPPNAPLANDGSVEYYPGIETRAIGRYTMESL